MPFVVAQPRGEFHLLDLEDKALKAVDAAWDEFLRDGKIGLVPAKLVTLIIEVHKMIMQRMNSKYGLDGTAVDLETVLAALEREKELVVQMIEQQKVLQ